MTSFSDTFCFSAVFEVASWTPSQGEIVENFGQIGRVVGEHRSVQGEFIGIVIQEIGASTRWIANPARCRPVR
ncbi:MAG: hypothetical protein ACRD1P_11875 [Thermoanaerobaculia bacterium]